MKLKIKEGLPTFPETTMLSPPTKKIPTKRAKKKNKIYTEIDTEKISNQHVRETKVRIKPLYSVDQLNRRQATSIISILEKLSGNNTT